MSGRQLPSHSFPPPVVTGHTNHTQATGLPGVLAPAVRRAPCTLRLSARHATPRRPAHNQSHPAAALPSDRSCTLSGECCIRSLRSCQGLHCQRLERPGGRESKGQESSRGTAGGGGSALRALRLSAGRRPCFPWPSLQHRIRAAGVGGSGMAWAQRHGRRRDAGPPWRTIAAAAVPAPCCAAAPPLIPLSLLITSHILHACRPCLTSRRALLLQVARRRCGVRDGVDMPAPDMPAAPAAGAVVSAEQVFQAEQTIRKRRERLGVCKCTRGGSWTQREGCWGCCPNNRHRAAAAAAAMVSPPPLSPSLPSLRRPRYPRSQAPARRGHPRHHQIVSAGALPTAQRRIELQHRLVHSPKLLPLTPLQLL